MIAETKMQHPIILCGVMVFLCFACSSLSSLSLLSNGMAVEVGSPGIEEANFAVWSRPRICGRRRMSRSSLRYLHITCINAACLGASDLIYVIILLNICDEIGSYHSCFCQATGTFMFMSLDKHGEERRASKILIHGRGKL